MNVELKKDKKYTAGLNLKGELQDTRHKFTSKQSNTTNIHREVYKKRTRFSLNQKLTTNTSIELQFVR